MIGFVLIVVLVVVIGLIFLVVSLRQSPVIENNKEIENFLESALLFTSECQLNQIQKYEFKDLISACYMNKYCINGENACDVLNKTSHNLIETSWKTGKDMKYKSYIFRIHKDNENLIYLSKGNSTKITSSAEVFIPVSGEIFYIEMKISY